MPRNLWLGDANSDGATDVMIDHDDDGEAVAPATPTGLGPLDRGISATAQPDRTHRSLNLDGDPWPDRVDGDQSFIRLFATHATRGPTVITRAPDFVEYAP